MSGNQEELLEKLQQLLKHKKSRSFYASRLGVTEEVVGELLKELRREEAETGAYIGELEETILKINKEKGTLESSVVSSFEPKNDEELAQLHRVDLTKYKISSYWTKQRGDKFTSSLLCTLIKPTEFSEQKFIDFLSTYTPQHAIQYFGTLGHINEEVDIEISIADFHLDKLTVVEESIEERKGQYMRILSELIQKVTSVYNIGTLAFIISNDFFHTDNIHNQTTSGTQLEVSTTWNKAYEEGFDLMVWAINFLSKNCKDLEVILVQGNHDRTKSYYMAHALEVYFKSVDNIWFDRKFDNTKYTVLGNTFIGYHHGNTKIDDLPLIFATSEDSSREFGSSKYREVHTGDKHYYLVKEVKGVRIQQLPSLAGTDRWHKDGNFVNNIRAGLALIYHPTQGKVGEFEARI